MLWRSFSFIFVLGVGLSFFDDGKGYLLVIIDIGIILSGFWLGIYNFNVIRCVIVISLCLSMGGLFNMLIVRIRMLVNGKVVIKLIWCVIFVSNF